MTYLVTGGTGFIGSYVVRDLLDAGGEVVCLQRSGGVTPIFLGVVGKENVSKVKIVQGDISNSVQIFDVIKDNHIDKIVHTSYLLLSGGMSESQPAYSLQVNCVGMSNLLEAARLLGVKKIAWTSSCQALGDIGKYYQEPIRDDAFYKPDSMYSATKVLNECMLKVYYDNFGVDCVGFRLGFILGVGRPLGRGGAFTQFLKNVATDIPTTMATMNADQVRPLGYVENISDLLVKACDAPITKTRTFNAVDYSVSCRQIVESMLRVNPKAEVTIRDGVSSAEATWGGAQEPIIDVSGIKTELGWQPKYGLDEALRKIFNYFREQAGLSPL
jgi:UDP-glucose 4-epimerase